jgi:hypothetical protein
LAPSDRTRLRAAGRLATTTCTELSRVTDDPARDRYPRFSPDGTTLAFYSNKGGPYEAWSIRLDGSRRPRLTDIPDADVEYAVVRRLADRITPLANDPQDRDAHQGSAGRRRPDDADVLVSGRPTPGRRDFLPSGTQRGSAVYDLASGTVTQLSDDAGGFAMAWMPDDRRILYFTASGRLMIQDLISLKRHEVAVKLPLPPDVDFSLAASPDGRTLYYGAPQLTANIWKVERPKPAKK